MESGFWKKPPRSIARFARFRWSTPALDHERILYCRRCRGMLIPMDIFAPLVDDLRSRRDVTSGIVHPLDTKALDRRVQCPDCRQDMDSHVYGGGATS